MSRELKLIYPYAGDPTLYGCLRTIAGLVWYPGGSVFEVWGTGSRTATDYDIAVTHRGGSVWTADVPTGMAADLYNFIVYLQTGASPANGDMPIANVQGRWTGTEWQGAISFVSSVPS